MILLLMSLLILNLNSSILILIKELILLVRILLLFRGANWKLRWISSGLGKELGLVETGPLLLIVECSHLLSN